MYVPGCGLRAERRDLGRDQEAPADENESGSSLRNPESAEDENREHGDTHETESLAREGWSVIADPADERPPQKVEDRPELQAGSRRHGRGHGSTEKKKPDI